jgi:hypothetical protein
MVAKIKNVSIVSSKSDEELEKFWEKHEPEDFEGWQDGNLKFKRPPKKLILLRIDPIDFRVIFR